MSIEQIGSLAGAIVAVAAIVSWIMHRINKIVITAITDVVLERTEGLQKNGGSSVGDLPARVERIEDCVSSIAATMKIVAERQRRTTALMEVNGCEHVCPLERVTPRPQETQ